MGFVLAGALPHTILALTWSLAIEEQFYLLWPLAVRWLRGSGLVKTCVACIALAPLLRGAWLLWEGAPLGAFLLTPCRMDTLAVGAGIAIAAQTPAGIARLRTWAPRVLAVTGTCVVALTAWRSVGTGPADPLDSLVFDPWMQVAGYSLLAFFYGSVVVLAAFPRGRGTGWLRFGVLRSFGKYSYAMYLTHTFVGGLVILYVFDPADHPGWVGALASYLVSLAAMLAVAMASWWLIEVHFDRLKRRFAYRK